LYFEGENIHIFAHTHLTKLYLLLALVS